MRTSDEGIAFIANFEGFRSRAYLCAGGKWTIGYGHTKGVRQGDVCTPSQGLRYLRDDVAEAERTVERYVNHLLRQCQFDALVSFVFNVGAGNFRNSTLRRVINNNPDDYDKIEAEFLRWVYANGKTLVGLVRRRTAESKMYRNEDNQQ